MCKVSVVIPNYNHARFLKQRIDSVLDQSFQDFEIILLDDCSTDDSRTVIEQYRDNVKVTHIEYNDCNSGSVFRQWKKGVELATGEWVWIAESDDWADNTFLEYMLAQAGPNEDCGLAYSMPVGINLNGEIREGNGAVSYAGTDFIRKRLYYGNAIRNVSAVIMKKSVLMSLDWSLFIGDMLCGDWFCYVLMAEKTNVLFCPESHSSYRVHDGNSSSMSKKCGLSLIEGVGVLRYIDSRYKVNRFWAAAVWGHYLASIKKRYRWDNQVCNEVTNCLRGRYWLVLLFSQIFRLRRYGD